MSYHFLITGGAGFIGSNYVNRLLQRGERVTVYDNLSRSGAPFNLKWLQETHGKDSFELVIGDVRDAALLTSTAQNANVIVHLASQVAVTTSVIHPREDFEINAIGTFNVLEAARLSGKKPIVLYASTNKVYGGMENEIVEELETRYRYADLPQGVAESQSLDFHSPYGCSKGAGDQYVRDYARIYDIPSVVLRQSCIYGPRQFGIEDQGWVAWFAIAALTGKPITIYGDGKQVRDLLYVDDLLNAYDASIERIDQVAGRIYNLGGGLENAISVWLEFRPLLEKYLGRKISVDASGWRPGDQKIYISDIRKARQELDWQPAVKVEDGIRRLVEWVSAHPEYFSKEVLA
jgi:CDP-paratose 2-epimerase